MLFHRHTLCQIARLVDFTTAFDGDVINIIGIMNEQVAYAFRKFDPIDRMIISRDNGRVNGYFMNTKDQLLTIREFARI